MKAKWAITVHADEEVGLRRPRPAHSARSITLRVSSHGLVDFNELKVAVSGENDFPGRSVFKSWAKALAPKGRWTWTLPLEAVIGKCMKQASVFTYSLL